MVLKLNVLSLQWGPLLVLLGLLGCCDASSAATPLRYGVLDSVAYPLVTRDAKGMADGGLLFDVGGALARELEASIAHVPLSRRRLESAVQSGQVDVICFLSPQWVAQPEAMQWSMEVVPQVERLVTLRGKMPASLSVEHLQGKRVATQLGFRYPALQPWFDTGRVKRVDETRVANLFKALEVGSSDAMVSTEDEIEGYFHTQTHARERFELSSFVVSNVATQCAVSKRSRHTLAAIDKALATLIKRGDIARLSGYYRRSAR